MALPNPSMSFSPFAILTAEELNDIVANIEALADGSGLDDGVLLNRHYANDSVSSDKLEAGIPCRTVMQTFSSSDTTTSLIPEDSSIPQSGEGKEFMTFAYTPTKSTSVLIIESSILLANNTNSRRLVAALFRSGSSNAIAVDEAFIATATTMISLELAATLTVSSTSPITFSVRAGGTAAGTTTFNPANYGAIAKSSIKVTEVRA